MRPQPSSNIHPFGKSPAMLSVIRHTKLLLGVQLLPPTSPRAMQSIACWPPWSKCNLLLLPRVTSSLPSKVSHPFHFFPPNLHTERRVPDSCPGKYYELLEACAALDAQALGALARADFERALSSPALGLQRNEVTSLPTSIRTLFFVSSLWTIIPKPLPLYAQSSIFASFDRSNPGCK